MWQLIWKPEQDGWLSYHCSTVAIRSRVLLPTTVSPNAITGIVAVLALVAAHSVRGRVRSRGERSR